jgi:hypothetical protein
LLLVALSLPAWTADPKYCPRELKRVPRSLPDGGTKVEAYFQPIPDGKCTVLEISDEQVEGVLRDGGSAPQ